MMTNNSPTPEELQKKIAAARHKDAPAEASRAHKGGNVAINMTIELVATMFMGGLLGYMVDDFFGSTIPFCFIIGLFLGAGAGFMAIQRINDAHSKEIEKNEENAQEMLDK